MVTEFLANQVCEKIIQDVKTSDLHFLLNETPYSAHITIRKKFTKVHADSSNVTLAPISVGVLDSTQTENKRLRIECKNMKEELEVLKHQKIILEDNLAGYAEENVTLNQKLFILKGEISIHTSLQSENQSLKDKMKVKLDKIEELQKVNLEKDDTIEMLNAIVNNKNLDEQTARTESSVKELDNCFTCDQCDFTSVSSEGIKIHMGRVHEVICDTCHAKFGGLTKLRNHMCRIHVVNPLSEFYYMKNWYVKHECIRVFCALKKDLLSVLHSTECVHTKHCSEFSPNLNTKNTVKDKEGLIHTYIANNMDVDTVSWDSVNYNIYIHDHTPVAEP